MKYRYLIEHSGDEVSPFHLTTVNPEGQSLGALGNYATVEDAKTYAEGIAQSGDEEDWGERVALVWKTPPAEWQPDAIAVSQYLHEMYPGLPA